MALDEDVLREAREARERAIGLQHETDLAQVSYQHAIRRLHAAGGSCREIADSLGLSYQRVHQIVDVGSGRGAVKECRIEASCSFCGVPREQLRRLIAGPGVFICEGCVDLARDVVEQRREAANERTRLRPPPPGSPRARCSFCGKKRGRTGGMAEALDRPVVGKYARRSGAVRACSDCLALCEQIFGESPQEASPA
jgi:hypothetical protein